MLEARMIKLQATKKGIWNKITGETKRVPSETLEDGDKHQTAKNPCKNRGLMVEAGGVEPPSVMTVL